MSIDTIIVIPINRSFSQTGSDCDSIYFFVGHDSVQMIAVLAVIVGVLSLSIFALAESGCGPPANVRGVSPPGQVNSLQELICVDIPRLSEINNRETLRHSPSIAGDLPRFNFKVYCDVPVF